MGTMRYPLGGVLLLGLVGGAGAVGTIDDSNASITTPNAPVKGEIVKDDCAPEAVPPAIPFVGIQGAMGTITNSFPDFPGGGSGADGGFTATIDMVLPGRTYEHTTYTVDDAVTVTYEEAVTIKTTGDVNIVGTVTTVGAGKPITIHCGGTFTFAGGPGNEARVSTNETNGGVTVHVAENFVGGASRFSVNGGNVVVVVHGLNQTAGTLDTAASNIAVSTGDVSVRVMGDFTHTADSAFLTTRGDIFVQSFTGDVTLNESRFNNSTGSGNINAVPGITVETGGSFRTIGFSSLNTSQGGLCVKAFGGDVDCSGNMRFNTSDGTIDIHASGSVVLRDASFLNTSTGDIRCAAFGGDCRFGTVASAAGQANANTSTGQILFEASRDVIVENTVKVNTSQGDILFRAYGGDVSFADVTGLRTTQSMIDVRTPNAITATSTTFRAQHARFSAGLGGLDLELDDGRVDREGSFFGIALGTVRMRGTLQAGGGVSLVSCDAGVDVSGATIGTEPPDFDPSTPSGDIDIRSFAGAAGTIDASNATISTGFSTVESGSISLLVHEGKLGNQPPPETIRSFLLPKKVKVTTGPGAKGPGLKAVGIFDTGGPDVDLMAPARLTLGPLVLNIPGLTPKGKSFVFKGSGVDLKVKQGGFGTSKGKFRLRFSGDFGAPVDLNGPFTVSYVGGGADAEGTVVLNNGKFSFAKIPGTLISPDLHIVKAKAKFAGVGRHPFKFVAGVAGDGVIPPMSPDIFVGFGDLFNTDIASDDVRLKGKNFVLKESPNPDGVAAIAFNFGRERVSVRGGEVDIGDVPEGVYPLLLIVKQDGDADTRAVLVTAARRGKILKY